MFAVRLLGASNTFLRLGWTDLKELGKHEREITEGENAQIGFAEESGGCSW